MTTTDPLTVNSVKMTDGTRFLSNGSTQDVTTVTYWLGRHGPFTLTYPRGSATSVQINNDINARQRELRQVLGVVPQP